MSRTAVLFLLLTLASFFATMAAPLEAGGLTATLGALCALSATLFVFAMVKGRRIKFDPYLR